MYHRPIQLTNCLAFGIVIFIVIIHKSSLASSDKDTGFFLNLY